MKSIHVYPEMDMFAVFQVTAQDSKSILLSGTIKELGDLRDENLAWACPDVVEDYSGRHSYRRPEPGEHIIDLVYRMMDEIDFDYTVYHNINPLLLCVHGQAV